MRNRGKALSRQEIMSRVWDTGFLDDTRTLTVQVRWLRLKIEDDPSTPRCLRTARGLGYRFDVPEPGTDLAQGQNAVYYTLTDTQPLPGLLV
jgi:DNA-binding response OmpR family regulator